MSTTITITDAELATILAGLRTLQSDIEHNVVLPDLADIFGDHGRPTSGDIDALCERINAGTPAGEPSNTAGEATP
jgi:hypothetical protein